MFIKARDIRKVKDRKQVNLYEIGKNIESTRIKKFHRFGKKLNY